MTAPQRPASNTDARKRAQDAAQRVRDESDEFLNYVRATAWEEGHKAPRRLGPDACTCAAWSANECACGLYGTGTLVSLDDNPYRPAS